jgi:hypothetical protein
LLFEEPKKGWGLWRGQGVSAEESATPLEVFVVSDDSSLQNILMNRDDMTYYRTSCQLAQETLLTSKFLENLIIEALFTAILRLKHVFARKKLPDTLN